MNRKWWRIFFHARLLSPRGLLLRAAALTVLFLIVHAAGLREYTSVLSGTSPTGIRMDVWGGVLGVAYVALYFGFVLLVPVLALAAGVFLFLQRLSGPKAPGVPVSPEKA